MGVALSKTATLAPISLASTIIGFISFAFTVGTFLRVFWANLDTLFAAESEIHSYLSNLRIELYEERASLRQLRRHNKEYGHTGHRGKGRTNLRLNDATLRSLMDIVRHLTQRFKKLERPFLLENDATGRRRVSRDPYGRESGNWEDDVKRQRRGAGRSRSRRRRSRGQHHDLNNNGATVDDIDVNEDDDDDEALMRNDYCDITLAKRFVWLKKRSEAISLVESLTRVQTRRIARQIGEVTVALYQYGGMIEDMRHDIDGLAGRMNRVVGIRRVD